jgi:hypothetical protein
MAAVMSGMLGLALGMFFPFQWIVAIGHGSKLSLVEGVAVAALTVVLAATTAARITLRLEPKT